MGPKRRTPGTADATVANDLCQGAGVVLPRRTAAGGPLRVGTLSWNLRRQEEPEQTVEDFLESLTATCQNHGECDVVASSGKTVAACPVAGQVLTASGGIPVVFEAVTVEGTCSWFVASERDGTPALTMLRREQLVNTFDEYWAFPHLAEVISAGAGVIRFEDSGLKLVLFICGENNVPQATTRTAFLKKTPLALRRRGALAEAFSGEWIMLNPAHRPYRRQKIRRGGFLKVGPLRLKDGRTIGRTLQRLVTNRTYFRDGTHSPVAVVHVNNFDVRQPETVPYASVVFADREARIRQAEGPTLGGTGGVEQGQAASWRYSVYEVQEGVRPTE